MGTKIVGILLIVSAILNVVIDALNGAGLDFQKHYESIMAALMGAGFIRGRIAIQKIENKM